MKIAPEGSWIDWLASLSESTRKQIVEELSPDDHRLLETDWRFTARPAQLQPPGEWRVWVLCCGRGYGKTRAGAEAVLQAVRDGHKRVALIGRSAADVRDVMVGGESGILACYAQSNPDSQNGILYEPSKRRLTWDNGAIATCYSADQPNQLRGPQHSYAWLDELASWRYPDSFDQVMLGLRLGRNPKCVITTTPKPRRFIRQIMKHPKTVITTGATKDNVANLSAHFLSHVYDLYKGTSLGRQELSGELLTEIPGALWKRDTIEDNRIEIAHDRKFARVIVAVDPATTDGEKSDESGIIVVALCDNHHFYILADCSMRGTPDQVIKQSIQLYHDHSADALVVEQNQGGDTWKSIAEMLDPSVCVRMVHASRGKWLRAEPVAARYEQGRVHHCGVFEILEDELCAFVQEGVEHDDRVDALVHGVTWLDRHSTPHFEIDVDRHYRRTDTAIWG